MVYFEVRVPLIMCMFSPYLRVACLVQNEIGVFHNGFIPFESGEVFGEIRITFPCVRFHPKQPESIVKKKSKMSWPVIILSLDGQSLGLRTKKGMRIQSEKTVMFPRLPSTSHEVHKVLDTWKTRWWVLKVEILFSIWILKCIKYHWWVISRIHFLWL